MELLNRYGSDGINSPYERITAVKHTGSVDAYIDDFVARAAQVPHLTDPHYLGYFLNGLRDDIQAQLRSHETTNLSRTMTLAREVEHALQISSAFSEPRRTSSPLGKMANSFGYG